MLQTRERIIGRSLVKADPLAGALRAFDEPVSETLSVRAVPSWRTDTERIGASMLSMAGPDLRKRRLRYPMYL
jgi:hypothetical protein